MSAVNLGVTGSFRGYPSGGRARSVILTSSRSSGISRAPGMGFGVGMKTSLDLDSPLPKNDISQQAVRVQETQQITGLNDRFACFIDQVRALQAKNAQLKIKLDLLQKQGTSTSNIDSMFQMYIENLKRQLETLGQEKLKFESDLAQMQALVEDFKCKYEDEINKRTEMENEFVIVKKDVDESYMNKVELEARLEALTDEINFLKSIFDEEIRELQAQIQNTSVCVQVDTARNLDVSGIIDQIKNQYKILADSNRNEAEQWKQTKIQELSMSGGNLEADMRSIKTECNDLKNMIRKINADIDNLKKERVRLENEIREAEERGEMSLKGSKDRIRELQEAIQRAKQEMARQAQELESLMNVKLGLDIEIIAYRKLLEGEETRMAEGVKTLSIQSVQHQGDYGQFNQLSNKMSGFLHGAGEMESSSIQIGTPLITKSVQQSRSQIQSSF